MRETIYKHNKKTLFEKKNLFLCINSLFVYSMYRVVVIYYERLQLGSRYYGEESEIRADWSRHPILYGIRRED